MSAFGTKRTCHSHLSMSAFGGKADIAHADQAQRIAVNIAKLLELLLKD